MAKIDITLPTTTGEVASLSSLRGKAVFIVAEARSHSKINEAFKSEIQSFVQSNAAVASKIELVVIALLGTEQSPPMLRPLITAGLTHIAQASGIPRIWIDWKDESPAKFGVPPRTNSPCYALINKDGDVVWGAYGAIGTASKQALMETLKKPI